jgi:hypothetical protein
MAVVVRPVSPERWADLESVFEAKGCSIARGCWCMYYRTSGKTALSRPGESQPAQAKAALKKLAGQDPPPGLIGYRGKTAVGWIALGPRQAFAKCRQAM